MLYRATDAHIRVAYDPSQVSEDTAITLLRLYRPETEDGMTLHHE